MPQNVDRERRDPHPSAPHTYRFSVDDDDIRDLPQADRACAARGGGEGSFFVDNAT